MTDRNIALVEDRICSFDIAKCDIKNTWMRRASKTSLDVAPNGADMDLGCGNPQVSLGDGIPSRMLSLIVALDRSQLTERVGTLAPRQVTAVINGIDVILGR